MANKWDKKDIDNLKQDLYKNLQECQINLDKPEFEKYIDTLNTPVNVNVPNDIPDKNNEKLVKLNNFSDYLREVNEAFVRNCEKKQNYTFRNSLIYDSLVKSDVSNFMDSIVNTGYEELKNNLQKLAKNNYIPSIQDTLGISQDNLDKLFNEDTYYLAGKFARIIDFIKDAEDSNQYQNGKTKNDLKCSLKLISSTIDTVIKQNNSQKLSIQELNSLYTGIKKTLNDDLKNVYEIKENGQPIKDFKQVKHTFEHHTAEITDAHAKPNTPLYNIHHPMVYLLRDLDERRKQAPNFTKDYKVSPQNDRNGWEVKYNNHKYKMGNDSKVLIEKGSSVDEISGNFNPAGNGTQMNITHPENKLILPISFQASINATVDSMQKQFCDPANPDAPVKFALKLNSQSLATCQIMFTELANYAEAKYTSSIDPTDKNAQEYNKRFDHFKDIFINGVKLEKSLFDPAQYIDQNNNQVNKAKFVEAVWNKIESTLKNNQQTNQTLTDEMNKLLVFANQR